MSHRATIHNERKVFAECAVIRLCEKKFFDSINSWCTILFKKGGDLMAKKRRKKAAKKTTKKSSKEDDQEEEDQKGRQEEKEVVLPHPNNAPVSPKRRPTLAMAAGLTVLSESVERVWQQK